MKDGCLPSGKLLELISETTLHRKGPGSIPREGRSPSQRNTQSKLERGGRSSWFTRHKRTDWAYYFFVKSWFYLLLSSSHIAMWHRLPLVLGDEVLPFLI